MNLRSALVATGALSLLAPCAGVALRSFAADTIAGLQARFDSETNSVRKAKLFAKLGDAQFLEARGASKAGDFSAVGLAMEKYRDNAREALAALRQDHPRAEKDSKGYRILEIHVRRSLRELDETLLVASLGFRPPLELVRKDLKEIQDQILRLLFPRRPGEKPLVPRRPPSR